MKKKEKRIKSYEKGPPFINHDPGLSVCTSDREAAGLRGSGRTLDRGARRLGRPGRTMDRGRSSSNPRPPLVEIIAPGPRLRHARATTQCLKTI